MTNKSISKPRTVACIVLNYKGLEDTKAAIHSLSNQTYSNSTIITIDNGSHDGSLQELKKLEDQYQDKLIILSNDENTGFAGGVNIGIMWAIDNTYDYIALFNNDALADEHWLDVLVSDIEKDSQLAIVTSLLLLENAKTIDSTGEFYSKWGLSFPRNRNDPTSIAPESGYIFGATGGASLYRTELFNDIGMFDEDFFAYYEDVDISFRAQLAGWKIKYNANAIAYHKQGATSKKIPGFAVYQTFKNLPLLFIKNVPDSLLFSVGIRFYFAYILMYLNSFTHQTGWMATKGLFKALSLKPKAIKQRIVIQKNKTVTDEYIKSILWDDLPPDQTGIRKVRKLFTRK